MSTNDSRTAGVEPDYVCLPADAGGPLDLNIMFGCRPKRLEVDVGCGKGRFLLARATAHCQTCFLGLDRNHNRLAKIARRARRANLTNLRLLHGEAAHAVECLLPPASVDVYYIFFPDPWPKRRHHRRRLFTPPFLDALAASLVPCGLLHVATDHLDYFKQIHALLKADKRFQERPPFVPAAAERTDFEIIYLNQQAPIGRCSFQRSSAPAGS